MQEVTLREAVVDSFTCVDEKGVEYTIKEYRYLLPLGVCETTGLVQHKLGKKPRYTMEDGTEINLKSSGNVFKLGAFELTLKKEKGGRHGGHQKRK